LHAGDAPLHEADARDLPLRRGATPAGRSFL
jgi:hypothetical protein